MKKRML